MNKLKWLSLLLLMAPVSSMAGSMPELQRLFVTVEQRQQIDLERKRALSGAVPDVESGEDKRLPDIYFQAILFQPGDEPILWINNEKKPVSQWRSQVGLLVLDQLWVEDEMLGIELKGKRWLLKPNQIFDRQLAEVVEEYKYVPVSPALPLSPEGIPGQAASDSRSMPTAANQEPDAGQSGAATMLKNAAAINASSNRLPQ